MQDSIDRGWEERTVEVDRLQLIKTLKENKEKHIKNYKEAIAGYKKAAREKLDAQFAKAEATLNFNKKNLYHAIDQFDPEEPLDREVEVLSGFYFTLDVPQNHAKSYEVAIQMAEWCVNKTITITQSQFQCFVMDDWEWKKTFIGLQKRYTQVR